MHLLVGTYSTAQSRGIAALLRDGAQWRLGDVDPAIENASFSVCHPRLPVRYFVDERGAGAIGAYVRRADGAFARLGVWPSGGAAPCHLDITASGDALAVANYESGSTALYRLDLQTGALSGSPTLWQNHGRGPNPERQAGPHAHCVRFCGGRLYRVDLGTDEIIAHDVAGSALAGPPRTVYRLSPGEGPRQIVFHPLAPIAYVLSEMGSRLHILTVSERGLGQRRTLSTLPAGHGGDSLGGHIALNRRADRLYVSNRGHDSIAVFAVSPDGLPQLIQIAPAYGASPRHFRLLEDPGQMVVAHEEGDSIAVMDVASDGSLGGLRQALSIKKPAFVGVNTPGACPSVDL